MIDPEGELATIQALVTRFERQVLPRLLALRKRLDRGEPLSELDIRFLSKSFHDVQQSKHLIDRHPDWHRFCIEVIHLHKDIMDRAARNEKNPSSV